ncbi:hypothetical protein SFP17_030 [Shigella phage SFP17]|uniref:Uncharacterized protein n=1 Tax=Shigella phage SFP17 TaxID=2692510 RepID=A0AAE6RGM4_9CAUD|nr:hypothetical protein SFP17_030 [Shigella phage SFP17]
MAEYGVSTWDANGKYNNYGIKPVSVVGVISLAAGQTSGSWSFSIPSGFKVGYVVSLDEGARGVGREIVASGNTIRISPISSVGPNRYSSSKCELVVFLERA